MEFKLCECIMSNGEMCARYIEKTDDLYCCEHINLNTELNKIVYSKQPSLSTSVCCTISFCLMLLFTLFFCKNEEGTEVIIQIDPYNRRFNHS